MKIISWNVAGINACIKKGLMEFIKKENAEIYCFQEVKASKEKFPKELTQLKEYSSYNIFAEKNGYSGVSVLTKVKPVSVIQGLGNNLFDSEGRAITLEFKDFFLINVYFPHSSRDLSRLNFKLSFNRAFLSFCKELEKRKPLIISSDFNVAHKDIDLKNPKQNKNNAGFTPQEREWFDSFLKSGFIDAFREFNQDGGNYTWWAYRNKARERNIGWRIDYFTISQKLKPNLISSKILKNVLGSDHCPILLELNLFF